MFQAKADKDEFDIVPYITLCVLDDICGIIFSSCFQHMYFHINFINFIVIHFACNMRFSFLIKPRVFFFFF